MNTKAIEWRYRSEAREGNPHAIVPGRATALCGTMIFTLEDVSDRPPTWRCPTCRKKAEIRGAV